MKMEQSLGALCYELVTEHTPNDVYESLNQLASYYGFHQYIKQYDIAEICHSLFADFIFNFGRLTALISFILFAPGVTYKVEAIRIAVIFLTNNYKSQFQEMGGTLQWIIFVQEAANIIPKIN